MPATSEKFERPHVSTLAANDEQLIEYFASTTIHRL
jgi:hypothetical protein